MSSKTWVLLILWLLLMVGSVSAETGDRITLTSSKVWVVANTVDTATLTAHVTNQSSGNDVPSVSVTFTVDNPLYGSVTSATGVTDTFGLATTTFKANKTSGTAIIKANITSTPIQDAKSQLIDHDSPYTVAFDYEGEVVVNETTTITATLTDKWGNRIDNRYLTENVHFAVGSSGGGAGFYDGSGYPDEITLPVNAAGTVSVIFKADTIAGDNIVWMEHLGSITDKYFTIVGISEGLPYSMITEISPTASPNPYVPADGMSVFSLKYTLKDVFDNAASNRSVWINTSAGETYLLRSNSVGEILVTYGPKDSIATITIDAMVVDNPDLTSTLTVEFVSTAPTNIILTANPETMPSHDASPSFTADIKAKVMDIKGNPVAGETVTFSNASAFYDGSYNTTFQTEPLLLATSATTDSDGYATVEIRPGSFSSTSTDLHYNPTATGHAVVTATWGALSVPLEITWKNYPYLSVETEVHPSTVSVNSSVDVTIRLKGDGWALMPDPIDVVMCTDRSGSMLYNDTDGIIDDRMVHAMNAGKIFNGQMGTRDRVGLVSFGDDSSTSGWAELRKGYSHQYSGAEWVGRDSTWTGDSTYISTHYKGNPRNYGSSTYATVEQTLSDDRSAVNSSIDQMVPAGGTPMREGLYRAVKMIVDNPRSNVVKAVILMTDGDWNTGGDPEGGGSATSFPEIGTGSAITWASDNDIKIFAIGLGVTSTTRSYLQSYADQTEGKYYDAPTAAQLSGIYTDIAGELKTSAGVNTAMVTKFDNVNVSGVSYPGSDVFKYVYLNGISTYTVWPNGTSSSSDQTADWNDDQNLNFNIGEIKLGEMWESTFRLHVLKDGNIDVFGTGSTLSFVGGAGPSTLTLPHTFITAVPNLSETGLTQTTLDISNLRCTKEGTITDFLPVEWNLAYTGSYWVIEKVYYSNDAGHTWILFDTNNVTSAVVVDYANLDVRSLPIGEYLIRVDAEAPDTPFDREILVAPVTVGSQGKAYIKLE